jgi:hypothetical protein
LGFVRLTADFKGFQRFIGVNPKYKAAAKPGGTSFEI